MSEGEVTAEAVSGMGVSEQTGFQVKIWKESRIDTDFDSDGVDDSTDAFPTDPNETVDADGNGIGDNADAAAAVVLPVLNISIVGTNAELSWDDTQSFDLHYSNDLSAWTNTNINVSPHSRALSTTEFFKLIESAPEPEPEVFQNLSLDVIEQVRLSNYTVYRLYANIDSDARIDATYGNNDHPLEIAVQNGSFYQNVYGGPLSTSINPNLIEISPELEWDSYIKIGSLNSKNNELNDIGISFTDFENGNN